MILLLLNNPSINIEIELKIHIVCDFTAFCDPLFASCCKLSGAAK